RHPEPNLALNTRHQVSSFREELNIKWASGCACLQPKRFKRIDDADLLMEKEIRRIILHPAGVCPDHVVAGVKGSRKKQRSMSGGASHRYLRAEHCLALIVHNFHIDYLAKVKWSVKRYIHHIVL